MAISQDSAVGAIEHGDHTAFEEVKTNAEAISNQVSGNASLYPQYGDTVGRANYEDFAGFDAANRASFDSAINQYVANANAIIAGFDNKSDAVLGAFKGKVAGSLTAFFTSIKKACQAYVHAIDEEKAKVEEAENNWLRATESISSDIQADSDAIRPVTVDN